MTIQTWPKYNYFKTKEGEIIRSSQVDDSRQLMDKEPKNGNQVVAQLNSKWVIIVADGKCTGIIEPIYYTVGYPNNLIHVQKYEKMGYLIYLKENF